MKTHKNKIFARKEILAGYLMIAPLMLGVMIFYVFAFLQNIYYSFTNKSSFGKERLIGWANYRKLLGDPAFIEALRNTLLYVLICVPAVVILSLLIAVLLNARLRFISFFRIGIFLPAVTLPAAIALLWRWLMNYKFGIFNAILGLFGLPPAAWLSDPKIVLWSVSAVFIWAGVAYQVIILLAGLQGIPSCYKEAARMDGANEKEIFFHITLPLLSPSIFFVSVTTIINVFQIFDFIYLMIPAGSSGTGGSRSLATYFFEQSFVKFHKGYGSAISIMLFLLILLITFLQLICRRKLVFYDD